MTLRSRQKRKRTFFVRLIVSFSPPSCGQLFVIFFGVHLTLYYDLMCSRMDFTPEKIIFIQLQEIPTPPYWRCCSVTKRSDSGVAEALKALKMHFGTPHNEIKCVLSIIESYSIEKYGSKFSHLLTVRAALADPPPTVSLTVKYPFFTTPLYSM